MFLIKKQKEDCSALKKLHKLKKQQLWKTCGKLLNEPSRILEQGKKEP